MSVTLEYKAIAKHALKAFGGTLLVQTFHHDKLPLKVDLLRCEDRPMKGFTSYSTIGLSDHPMPHNGAEFHVRLELAGVCESEQGFFPNILAAAAFCIIRTNKLYHPGSVLPDYLKEYYPNTSVPHIYLAAPFMWGGGPTTLDCGSKKVAWLMVVPVSQAELEYLEDQGDKALEKLLETNDVDVCDLNRPSCL